MTPIAPQAAGRTGKRFLFVTQYYPSDFQKAQGIAVRMRLWLEAIAGLAGDLHVLIYVSRDVADLAAGARAAETGFLHHWGVAARVTLVRMGDPRPKTPWHHYVEPIIDPLRHIHYEAFAGSGQVEALRDALASGPEVLFLHRIAVACPLLRLTGMPLPPCYIDVDDIEHLTYLRGIGQAPRWPLKRLYYLHVPALAWLERRVIKRAAEAYVCSPRDAAYLRRYMGLRNVAVVPNCIIAPRQITAPPASMILVFIGAYSYQPNIAAAELLITAIWPLISASLPEARLWIVGSRCERIPSHARGPRGVDFKGFVADLDDLYRQVQVACCPITLGGGTRLKIVEAAAYGRPVVATRIGAEGLAFRDGEEIVLEDDPQRFALRCIELLTDPARCAVLGSAARAAATRHYDRDTVIARIRQRLGGAAVVGAAPASGARPAP